MSKVSDICKQAGIQPEVIQKFVGSCFDDPSKYDYKVIAAIVRLYCNLPGSHSHTSITKTLRGNAIAAVCKKQSEFGMLYGIRGYTVSDLMQISYKVDKFLKSGDVSEDEELYALDDDEYVPDWINTKEVSKSWGNEIADAVEAVGEQFGADREPKKAKKKAKTNVRPKEVQKRMLKMGFYKEAVKVAIKGTREFEKDNPGWSRYTWHPNFYRSRKVQDDSVTLTWRIGESVSMKDYTSIEHMSKVMKDGVEYRVIRVREAILVTTWSTDAKTLKNWEVTFVENKKELGRTYREIRRI